MSKPTQDNFPLAELFPFLIEVDADLHIRQVGRLMAHLCPEIQPGHLLGEAFAAHGANPSLPDFSGLQKRLRHTAVIKQQASPRRIFKGEWFGLRGGETIYFLGWPWITDTQELPALGISLTDLPAHNPLADMLLMLRTSHNTLADTQALAHTLHVRTQELEESHRKLQGEAALIRARDKAERESRAKSSFLANMSHELRTPMNAILGMTTLARLNTGDPTMLNQLGKIELASNHLLSLINDILDISKIEAEKLTLESTDFQVGGIVDEITAVLGERAASKGLEYVIDIAESEKARNVQGDPLRLRQILFNLLGNAIKFTDAGQVTLRIRPLAEEPLTTTLHFEVEDTGIGVSFSDQQRIFSAFEQADDSMSRRYGGTGLGLAISKKLVELMGGTMGISSREANGSLFWFDLCLKNATHAPISTLNAERAAAHRILSERHASKRVLLVEDEPVNQEITRTLLTLVGFEVDIANDGIEAIELAHKKQYALILMDMQLPRLSGVEAARAIRKDSANVGTPILAMTANAYEEDRQACLDAGMNAHLAKPARPETLYEHLLALLLNE